MLNLQRKRFSIILKYDQRLEKKEAESNEQKSIITNLRKELLDALNNAESLKSAMTEKTNEINE